MRRLKNSLIFLTFAAPLILSPFLLGGAYTVVSFNRIIIGVVAGLYLIWSVWILAGGRRLFIPYALFPLLVIFAWGVVQLVPLPPSFVEIVSPRAHYFRTLTDVKGWFPLTLSVPDTSYSLLRLGALLLFALMLQRTVESERRSWRHVVIATIVGSGVVVFVYGVFLKMTDTSAWLGAILRGPLITHPTLVNMNHAAAFFGIGALLAFSVAVEADFARARFFYGALFFVLLVGVVTTLSRGGILAFFLSLCFFLFLRYLKQRPGSVWLPLFLGVAAVFTAFYVGYHMIVTEFDVSRPDYFDKFAILATVKGYISDFWLTGSGLGSFMHVYPFYQNDPEIFFTQLENEPVQFALENGLFVACVVAGLFVWFFVKYNRGSHCHCGAAAILFFLLMHNTLDFNLHNFAILFPAIAIYLMASRSFEVKGKWRIVTVGASSLCAMVAIIGVLRDWGFDFEHAREALPYETLIKRYPSDFKIPLREAISRYNAGSREELIAAVPYLSEAMAKSPDYYYLYFLSGATLLRLGSFEDAVALFEKSIQRAPDRHLGKLFTHIYEKLRARRLERQMRDILPFGRQSTHDAISRFVATLAEYPDFVEFLLAGHEEEFFETAGRTYLSRGKYDLLAALLDRIAARQEGFSHTRRGRYLIFRGHLALQQGDIQQALSLIEQGSELTDMFEDILFLANLAIRYAPEKCAMIDGRLQNKAFVRREDLARYHRWKSDWLWSRGEIRSSLTYLQKGAEMGGFPHWRIDVARRLASQGLYEEAVAELTALKLSRAKVDMAAVERLLGEYSARIEKKRIDLLRDDLFKNKEAGKGGMK